MPVTARTVSRRRVSRRDRRRRARVLAVVVIALLLGATFVAAASHAVADPTGLAGRYRALTPQRLLDTRAGGTPIGPGQTRVLDFGSRISPEVDAVVVNVTTVNTTADGYLTLYPHGQARPTVSNVQHPRGVAHSSSVTVAVTNQGAGRFVDVFNNAGSTDLIVDLFGYYVGDPPPSGTAPSSYYPLSTSRRIYDSRVYGGKFYYAETRSLGGSAVDGSHTYSGVTAVAVTITVVTPLESGYLQAWDGAGAPPVVSTVNFAARQTTPNFAIVPVRCTNAACSNYAFSVRNMSSNVQVVVDLVGWYAASGQAGGTRFVAFSPYRVVDTRTGTPFGRMGREVTAVAPIGDSGGTSAVAANLTVTAVRPSGATYLSVFPGGGTIPDTSTVNAVAGQVVANATQTRVTGQFGRFSVYNALGTTDVVVDVDGAFAPE